MFPTLHADAALARRYNNTVDRILADHVAALANLQPETGASTMPIADGCALYLGRGTPPGPNRVTGLGMIGPITAEHLEAAEHFFAERGLPCVISVTPFADPSVVKETGARGYAIATFRNILARPIAETDGEPDSTGARRADVKVTPASPDEAELWAQVVGSGFAEQELDAPPAPRLATFQCPNTVCYVGRIDGIAAGGAALTIADGFAYIWDVSTRPAFRRRGVQEAIYRALLKEAARAGCDMAGLATEVGHGSQRNAERVGFRVIFTATAIVRQIHGGDSFRVR